MNIRSIIDCIPILNKAEPASKAKIVTYGISDKYQKGTYLFRVRDQVNRIYIVVSGVAVLERVNRNNDKRAIFLLSQGDIINEVILEEPVSSINCYALSDIEVVSFSRTQFLEIMEHDFYLTRMVIESMAKKIRKLYHQVENTTKMMKLDMQVASRLWKIARDYGILVEGHTEIPFDISITFLADLVGSNRETISRVIKKMSEDNILSIKNGKCLIYDMDALADIARK